MIYPVSSARAAMVELLDRPKSASASHASTESVVWSSERLSNSNDIWICYTGLLYMSGVHSLLNLIVVSPEMLDTLPIWYDRSYNYKPNYCQQQLPAAENCKFPQHQSSLFVIFQPSERKKKHQSCASNKLHSKILNKLPLSYRKNRCFVQLCVIISA